MGGSKDECVITKMLTPGHCDATPRLPQQQLPPLDDTVTRHCLRRDDATDTWIDAGHKEKCEPGRRRA